MEFILKWLVSRIAKRTPHDELAQQYALMILSARRCAYDLAHAVDEMPADIADRFFRDRSEHWLQLFSPDGVKNYRHEMHRRIAELEARCASLERDLKAAGGTSSDDWINF